MKKYHDVGCVIVSKDKLKLLIDGHNYEFILASISNKLQKANEQERNSYKISPSGYGISWPMIDEDISIDGLLKLRVSRRKKIKRTLL